MARIRLLADFECAQRFRRSESFNGAVHAATVSQSTMRPMSLSADALLLACAQRRLSAHFANAA